MSLVSAFICAGIAGRVDGNTSVRWWGFRSQAFSVVEGSAGW